MLFTDSICTLRQPKQSLTTTVFSYSCCYLGAHTRVCYCPAMLRKFCYIRIVVVLSLSLSLTLYKANHIITICCGYLFDPCLSEEEFSLLRLTSSLPSGCILLIKLELRNRLLCTNAFWEIGSFILNEV